MRVTEAFGRWREWSPTKTTESTPQDRDDCGAELRALRRSQKASRAWRSNSCQTADRNSPAVGSVILWSEQVFTHECLRIQEWHLFFLIYRPEEKISREKSCGGAMRYINVNSYFAYSVPVVDGYHQEGKRSDEGKNDFGSIPPLPQTQSKMDPRGPRGHESLCLG